MIIQSGYIEKFTSDLRSAGRYAFSLQEVRNEFKQSDEAIKKAIQRLIKKGEIAIIRNGFYIIITPEYKNKGMLPPSLFVSDLMGFLNRDYYVGLLNAAAYYGAAHQQPQAFSVITIKPSLRHIERKNLKINFYTKKEWSKSDILKRKTDSGFVNVSSPELTALDLVFYSSQSGGFNRVITILEELSESINAKRLYEAAGRFSGIAAIQRLGFILDKVLDKPKLSNPLKKYLKTINYFPVLLNPQNKKQEMHTGNEWKIVVNTNIDIDI
jgi:predicted transcriptional regulator of viral defense system